MNPTRVHTTYASTVYVYAGYDEVLASIRRAERYGRKVKLDGVRFLDAEVIAHVEPPTDQGGRSTTTLAHTSLEDLA